MKTYPNETCNPNVPDNVFLVAETSHMSGEIVTTYYMDNDSYMWRVGNWSEDKPNPVFLYELCRLTLDTEQMIHFRWESWRLYK